MGGPGGMPNGMPGGPAAMTGCPPMAPTGMGGAAATWPAGRGEGVVGAADIEAPPLVACIAYLGIFARCSSNEMSSGGWMILVEAEVVAMSAGFFCSCPFP